MFFLFSFFLFFSFTESFGQFRFNPSLQESIAVESLNSKYREIHSYQDFRMDSKSNFERLLDKNLAPDLLENIINSVLTCESSESLKDLASDCRLERVIVYNSVMAGLIWASQSKKFKLYTYRIQSLHFMIISSRRFSW